MANYTFGRIARSFRSIFVPLSAIIGFSCLLTWIFILYQPSHGPGLTQRMGWQSWAVVSLDETTSSPAGANRPVQGGSGSGTHTNEGVEWWNTTDSRPAFDAASLPLDKWAPLLPHDTGLTEITAVRCMVQSTVVGNLCDPPSTPEDDAIKGTWVRVERNLNLEAGYFGGFLHLHYRRTRRQDVPLITDIKLLPSGEEPIPVDNWKKVETSLRAGIMGSPALYLWYHLGKTAKEMSNEEHSNLITELDLLFGDDIPWYGFEKLEPATYPGHNGRVSAWLTYRRGVKPVPQAPPLHFSHNGQFRILQIADLHYSVSQGLCRDTPKPCKNSDNQTATLLAHVLDEEKPDMVVFSGDQLNGQDTSWDPKSVLAKFAKEVTNRKIPWAAIFGNHDSENGASREEQMNMMMNLPYSLVEPGPKDIHGVGNYVLKVRSSDPSRMHLLTLYFLDSGAYVGQSVFGWFFPTGYDWIRQNQIDWFLQQSASITPIERPFTPDTAMDLGHAWPGRRQEQIVPNTKKFAKPNAMMFFHMPLMESYYTPDSDSRNGRLLDTGTHGIESQGDAGKSDGFFEKGILRAMESDNRAKGNIPEVKVIANGHSHLTDNCRRNKGVWLCFGGGGSYSGYGRIGFDRRFRIYQVSDFGETIRTYKRTEHNEIIDDMILTGPSAPPITR